MRQPIALARDPESSRGALIARILTGAWRRNPPALDVTAADLASAASLLLESGAGPLAWWRVRHSTLADSQDGVSFRQAYRLSSIGAVLHRRALAALISHLRDREVEAIVVKGWAAARLYPEPGLRVYTDHDLLVRRAEAGRARDALASMTDPSGVVDLHAGSASLDELPEAELFARSVLVDCDGTAIRVLAPEDHVRVLCRHALRHGVVRPLWLSDVATAVEGRGPSFDWGRCLTTRARAAGWVTSVLSLAHAMLGLSIEGTPAGERAVQLPHWVVPAVRRAWDRAAAMPMPAADAFYRPGSLLHELRKHWPNPLQATFAVRGPINNVPRWPFQVAACVPGAWRVARGLLR